MEKNNDRKVCCKVENCVYHEAGEICTAPHINVGPQHACNSSDTVCSTFKAQDKNCCR